MWKLYSLHLIHSVIPCIFLEIFRKPFQEFETSNGDWSVPEVRLRLIQADHDREGSNSKAGSKASSRSGTPGIKETGSAKEAKEGTPSLEHNDASGKVIFLRCFLFFFFVSVASDEHA